MTDTLDILLDQAEQADAAYQRQAKEVNENPNWSAEGRKNALATAERTYRQQIDDIRQRGQSWLESSMVKAEKNVESARVAAVQRRRELLGDALTAQFLRDELATMDAGAIVEAIETAVDDWHKQVYASWGALELHRRSEGGNVEAAVALADLRRVAVDEELTKAQERLRDLRYDAQRLDELDPAAYRQKMGVTFGIAAEHFR